MVVACVCAVVDVIMHGVCVYVHVSCVCVCGEGRGGEGGGENFRSLSVSVKIKRQDFAHLQHILRMCNCV